MKDYVWCEDSGSGYLFWKEIFATLHPEMTVESKENNSNLRKEAKTINGGENTYYIIMDYPPDNPIVLREVRRLVSETKGKANIRMVKIHSFEFTLLSFRYLEDWVFGEEDSLREKRKGIIRAKDILVRLIAEGGDPEDLEKFKRAYDFEDKNTEQIASKLLIAITRNTGFETDKGHLGGCFVNDCCIPGERKTYKRCGLENSYITGEEKKRQLVEYSVIKDALAEAGL